MIIAVYNNLYSYELVNQYISGLKNYNDEVIMINTGLISSVTSPFCNQNFNLIKQLINLIKFKFFFLKNKNKVSKIIIPNTINMLCGFLHYYIKDKQYEYFLVEEGTRNFHSFKLSFIGRLKRISKLILANLIFVKYYYHNDNEFKIFDNFTLISCFPELNTSPASKIIIQKLNKKYLLTSNIVLIIGTHILDKKKISFKKNPFFFLRNDKFKNCKIIYLAHPRAYKFGINETKLFDKFISYEKTKSYLNAHNCITDLKPKYLIALGGSTTFFYYNKNDFNNLYVIGMNELICVGHHQYVDLKKIYKQLGINLI